MITLKLDSKLAGSAVHSLPMLADLLHRNPGMRIVGITEFAAVELTEPAPGEDKDPSVKIQIKAVEIGRDEQEHHLRQAMLALYRQRTATGTIDEAMQPALSDRTIELTAGVLDAVEAARLRIICDQWGDYIDRITAGKKLTATQAIEELHIIRQGLAAAIGWTPDPESGQ